MDNNYIFRTEYPLNPPTHGTLLLRTAKFEPIFNWSDKMRLSKKSGIERSQETTLSAPTCISKQCARRSLQLRRNEGLFRHRLRGNDSFFNNF